MKTRDVFPVPFENTLSRRCLNGLSAIQGPDGVGMFLVLDPTRKGKKFETLPARRTSGCGTRGAGLGSRCS